MRRLISLTLSFVFLVWILPLGVFIAPSKEKLFCGGERAICLCSNIKDSAKKSDAGQAMFKSNSGTQKGEATSATSFHYDSVVRAVSRSHDAARLYFSRSQNLYQFLVARPIEHVPKV